MAKAVLIYDIITGKNLLSPSLAKLAKQSNQLSQKFKGIGNAGTGSFTKIAGAGNRFTSSFKKMDSNFSGALSNMTERLKAWRIRNAANLNDFAANFKFNLGGRLPAIANPFAAAAVGVGGLVSGLALASEQAAQFENQFRAISNINQDKSAAEINRLKQQLANFSFTQAVNPADALTAYYDLQSATGKYGDEALAILQKVDTFSKATQGNFIDNINASSKAMVAFGFGVDKMDEYLISNAKTVKLGITTFEQLGQVQTEYLGAALNAGQGFNEANALFAAMTAAAKNTDIAATLTKGAFEGLSNPAVTKALQKQGVAIFDNKGKMLSLDKITANLYKKVNKLSDKKFQAFAGNVGGNEGFKAFLSKVKGAGSELQAMFDKFNNTSFDIQAALKLAENDPIEIRKRIAAKFSGLVTKIGLKLNLKGVQLSLLKKIEQGLDAVYRLGMFVSRLQIGTRLANGLQFINEKATQLADTFYSYVNGAYALFKNNLDVIQPLLIGTGIALVALNAQAVFSAITAIPSLAASLAFSAIQFVVVNAAALAFNAALILEKGIMLATATATGIFTAAQWALNVALNANPIGLIIAGLALAAAGLYIAYQKSETFRAAIAGIGAVIQNAFPIFKGFAKIIMGLFTADFTAMKEGFTDVIDGFKNFNPIAAFKKGFNGKLEAEAEVKFAENQAEKAKKQAQLEAGIEVSEDGETDLIGDIKGLLPEMPDIGLNSFIKMPELPEIPKVPTVSIPANLQTGSNTNLKIPKLPKGDGLNISGATSGDNSSNTTGNLVSGNGGTKNINVSIGKLFESISINANNLQEGASEVVDIISKGIVDAVRKAEIELSR